MRAVSQRTGAARTSPRKARRPVWLLSQEALHLSANTNTPSTNSALLTCAVSPLVLLPPHTLALTERTYIDARDVLGLPMYTIGRAFFSLDKQTIWTPFGYDYLVFISISHVF